MRVGIGFDAHKFIEGRPLILGGVNVDFEKGLKGHSDADVVLHAIIDAMLGAAALGNIGQFFPDNDNKYKNISSLVLLKETKKILDKNKFSIANVDAVIILEEPRLEKYWKKMQDTIGKALNMEANQVSVKAKTTEKMGFTGRSEGIAAQAVVLLET